MELTSEDFGAVRNRLARAKGQLEGVIRMLDDGADCEKLVTQLAACTKALDKAGYQLIAGALQQCLTEPSETMDAKRLEKLFLSLT